MLLNTESENEWITNEAGFDQTKAHDITTTDMVAVLDQIKPQEKCMMQYVQNVEQNVKFRSNLLRTDLSIVEIALQVTEIRRV